MHLVAQLIHDRIQGKKDNAVLALVIGGGTMRGAFAAGIPLVERWMRRKTGKFGIGFKEVFAERYARFNESLDLAFGRVPPPARVALLTVAPATLIGWAERRHTVLQRAVQEGREEMRKAIV